MSRCNSGCRQRVEIAKRREGEECLSPRGRVDKQSQVMPPSLPGHAASRVSSRSSGHTATGSQTPDLGTVREAADSRGYALHGRSTSRPAHLLSK